MLGIVRLFDLTLRQLLAVPELALFLGTALLLILIGIFSCRHCQLCQLVLKIPVQSKLAHPV